MSNVTFKETKKGYLIEAKGHATGSVEICAGISTVLQGLIWYLKKWGEPCEFDIQDGYLKVEFGRSLQCVTVYRMALISLQAIEDPDYLKVTEII